MKIVPLFLKIHDILPPYPVSILDSDGDVVDITGATIYCTMKNSKTGILKINRRTSGISILDAENGQFEFQWEVGDTDEVGTFYIEFEIHPLLGGKYTVPARDRAKVVISQSLDLE